MEIEQSYLAALLAKPDLFNEVLLTEEIFLNPLNRFCFQLLKKQFTDFKTISISGLYENYKNEFTKYEANEVIRYLSNVMSLEGFPSKFQYYQETLFREWKSSKIMEAIRSFQSNQILEEELLDTIQKIEQQSIDNSSDRRMKGEEIYQTITEKNQCLHFRFEKLCKYSDVREHDFVIVAARPGVGKTGFILNLMEDLSNTYNCILFNMEMSTQQIYRRLVGINTGINIKYFEHPETEFQRKKIREGCDRIAEKKIKVYTGSQTVRSIKFQISKNSREGHTVAFIDYVGLIKGDRKQNNYERVTDIVKELRQIAMDFNCTIFLVAQINRNAEKEKSKVPKLSDLKESGELEQSATTVLMLHNESYYNGTSGAIDDIQVIIGKNRNGETGLVHLDYDKPMQRFNDPKK